MDELWRQLLNTKSLAAGWHLARKGLSSAYIDDHLHSEAYAYCLGDNLRELRRQLSTDTFVPGPLKSIDVPKAPLGIRPGTFLKLSDYTVLYAAVRLIAPVLDKLLPDSVYSFRMKERPTKDALFVESDFIEEPFLKHQTISKWADPFDPWYALWPEFDMESRSVIDEGYRFLCVTDIAGYFENISLPILRDLLMEHLKGEQKIINLLMDCLEAWAVRTPRGFQPHRGIPQGNQISSFFGNLFLFPLDQQFQAF